VRADAIDAAGGEWLMRAQQELDDLKARYTHA
jgi:hypothetical protein